MEFMPWLLERERNILALYIYMFVVGMIYSNAWFGEICIVDGKQREQPLQYSN